MQTTRNLSPFYTGLDDSKRQQDTHHATQMITDFVSKWKGTSQYLDDSTLLLQALEEYNAIKILFPFGTNESTYLYMMDVTRDDPAIKAQLNKSETQSTKIFNDLKFFQISLGNIPTERQEVLLMDVRLEKYHFFLSEIFAVSHYQLSEKEEQLLSTIAGPAYRNRRRMIEEFIFGETFVIDDETLSFEEVMNLLSSLDVTKRDQAAEKLNEVLHTYLPVAEKEINSILDYKHRVDDLRGYDRPDRSAFIRDSIDPSVADTLSEVTQEAYKTSQQYYALKARLLGKEQLKYHERNIPIVVGDDAEEAYPLEKAIALVASVFNTVKSGYGDYVTQMFDAGRVDCFPRAGKRGGAFCMTDMNSTQGQRILLNHVNKLRDVTTIAHEFGHSLNGYLSADTHGGGVNHGSGGFFIAEVASTFFEGFVFDRLMNEVADPHQKIALLMGKLNDEISTIHRQIACYEFEKALHATKRTSGYVSHSQIGELFKTHMSAYMGDAVEQSAGSENRWLYWTHIRSFFYTYSYSAGLMLSYALQAKIKQDPMTIHQIEEKYFRNSGAKRPETIFASLGIDITQAAIWKTGLAQVQSLVDEVEALVYQHGRDA